MPNKEINRKFYLIGDAGKSPMNGMSLGLQAFKNHISNKATKKDVAVFLGDNIYPDGLPAKDEKGRAEGENALNAQVKALEGFKGDVVFIPGNHDWYADGVKGVKREEKYIEKSKIERKSKKQKLRKTQNFVWEKIKNVKKVIF